MNAQSTETLKHELDDLDRRVDARVRQLREQGEFSDVHEAFVKQLKKRQGEIGRKIDQADKGGVSWEMIKGEFQRDFHGLFGELLRWEEHLDASTMKKL